MRSSAVLSLSAVATAALLSGDAVCGFSTAPASRAAFRRTIGQCGRRLVRLNAAFADGDGDGERNSVASSVASSSSVFERRDVLRLPLLVGLAAASQPAQAVVVKPDKVFKVGAVLTEEEAEVRLRDARDSVRYLLDHYDEVCEGGGDNVRRYLGTVGTTSGLYGISKAMKALADRADDIVEYTELSNEIETNVQQADGSSYMAIFVVSSTSQDRPEKYFGQALVEIKRLEKNIDELAAMVGVDVKR